MMNFRRLFSRLVFCLLGGMSLVQASVTLPAIISDHAVLTKSPATPIWGKADPNEAIAVTFNGKTASATAGADGKWKATLDLSDSPPGPFDLTVTGTNTVTVRDVVVGQAWLCIGQSNMERIVKDMLNGPQEAAQSTNPMIRNFKVVKIGAPKPAEDVKGSWVVAAPNTTGDFCAIGYYFSKKMYAETKEPMGMIDGSWSGTFIEGWLSDEVLNQLPDLKATEDLRRAAMAAYPEKQRAYVAAMTTWVKANNREDAPTPDPLVYAGPDVSTADWTPVNLPGKITGGQLPENGVIWLRKDIDVPAGVQGIVIKPSLGMTTGFIRFYWNGKMEFDMPFQKIPGSNYMNYFGLPAADIKAGKTTIAIRLYAPGNPAEIIAPRFNIGPIPISGQWMAKAETTFPTPSADALAQMPVPPHNAADMKVSDIYNGTLAPLMPYGLKGMMWYQGESNTDRAEDYAQLLQLFITDVRTKWGTPNLPFYICQLANYGPKVTNPGDAEYAELREAQAKALTLPNTNLAVLIDLGESDDIHARDKKTVGERLARIALAQLEGQKIVYSGPMYDSMAVEGSKIRVKFTHVDGGLVAKPLPATYVMKSLMNQTAPLVPNSPGSQLEGFAICGADHHWVWAQAKIDGDSVLVWSAEVSTPVAIRYGWSDDPNCNLYNVGDLPASPFRTDDFQRMTHGHHFAPPPPATARILGT